jgi:hypothetical protein
LRQKKCKVFGNTATILEKSFLKPQRSKIFFSWKKMLPYRPSQPAKKLFFIMMSFNSSKQLAMNYSNTKSTMNNDSLAAPPSAQISAHLEEKNSSNLEEKNKEHRHNYSDHRNDYSELEKNIPFSTFFHNPMHLCSPVNDYSISKETETEKIVIDSTSFHNKQPGIFFFFF